MLGRLGLDLRQTFLVFGSGDNGAALSADATARVLSFAFAALLIVLLLLRPPPKAKSRGGLPRATAFAGAFASIAFIALPEQSLPLWLSVVSAALIVAGTAAAIYALVSLGRSFSVFPEARRLVTEGPYRLVRHPLYLFEQVALVGVMLQYLQPWSLLLFVVQLGFQLLRMHYEESVLAESFPEYRTYAAHTPRLLPGLY